MEYINRGYIKRGSTIDMQIENEYYITAAIKPSNSDKTEFLCSLSLHNVEAGISVELDESFTISSTYRTVNKDVAASLNTKITSGCFSEAVKYLRNMLSCLDALLDFQNRLRKEN